MAKKYLSLEEAAGQLGLSQEALKKAREQGTEVIDETQYLRFLEDGELPSP